MIPVLAWNDCQVAAEIVFEPVFAIDHQCKFSNSESVHNRYRMHADETFVCGIQHRTINIVSVRIWSVKNNERNFVFRAGFHDVVHRRNESVEAYSNILNIEHNHINIFQIFG
ncbi:hypothetical protein SDC9_92256 [bioreactor metagenome]|uniref:Uncharacterized protein n=1 Tax=bioreactor metagenome TaxID=1076179 RepID=A0A644ZYR8_9ZZZZ